MNDPEGLAARLAAREAQLARLRGGLSEGKRAALERRLRGAAQAAPALPAIPRRPPAGGGEPTSFAQERLWFIDQLEPGSSAYNLAAAVTLAGALDLPAMRRAMAGVVRRHGSLRTTFASRGGQPVQVIAPADAGTDDSVLPVVDLGGLGERTDGETLRLAQEAARRPFDLAAGPLFSAVLLRESALRSTLVVTLHHIITDAWSMGVLVRELAALYAAFAAGGRADLPELPIQYVDYARWQREWLSGAVLDEQLAYWRRQLAGLPPELAVPADRPRPAVSSGHGDRVSWQAGPELTARLRALTQEGGATLFMTLLAVFQGLMGRLAGQSDVAVGAPIAGRARVETEGLIGFFVNTLVLRLDLGGGPDFNTLLARARDTTLGAFAHQEIPFERLVAELRPERAAARNPLFQVSFVLQNAPSEQLRLPGLTLGGLPAVTGASLFDLALEAVEAGAGLDGALEYGRDLFDGTTAARFARCFMTLLAAVAEAPARRFDDLPLLAGEERHQLLHEWSGGPSPYPRAATVHGLFAEWVRRTPAAVALVSADGGEVLTYAGLAARAALLARRLRGWGVGPEIPVAFCLARSPRMVVALLAILEAGGAYLPLDPAYPRERLALMLGELRQEDGGRPPLLLTEERLAGLFPWFEEAGGRLVHLDDLELEPEPEAPGLPPPDDVQPENLAYIMYTSGSTGRPKGVAVTHRAVVRLVRDTGYARYAPDEVMLQLSAISFDASTPEIWGALLNGGRLVMAPAETLTLAALGELLERHRVTALFMTPALLHQMIDDCLEGLRPVRQLLAGGDVVSPPHARRLLAAHPALRLVDCYGPTENTTFTCCGPLPLGAGAAALPPGAAVSIGRPIANTDVFVICGEERLEPFGPLAPIGVEGELVTGGDGLARGYWRRPELTAERFRPHPFAASPGERVYRTGDRARFLADGRLDFLGRKDRQVKVRGFRVEPAEIEAMLATHPEVREAVVLALPEPGAAGTGRDKRLVAYLVARDGGAPAPAELRAWLRQRLPDYMVPQHFLLLAELPVTANGKVDRAVLPLPEGAAGGEAAGEAQAPRTPEEELLAGIWAEVLGRERVGVDEDFFEIGGHSLLATRVASRVREVFGVELPLRRLFEARTVAALAPELAAARRQGGSVPAPPRPVPRDRELPLSFAQERLWFLAQLDPHSPAYNLAAAVRLEGALDLPALRRALAGMVRRHESLRTTFASHGGQLVQVIAPAGPAGAPARWGSPGALPVVDVSRLTSEDAGGRAESEARRLVSAAARRQFDLAAGPLFAAVLLRESALRATLVVALHHIVTDGWSMGVLIRELAALYDAFAAGAEPALPELPIQYADYARWQRAWLSGPVLDEQLAYWRGQLAGLPPELALPVDRPRPPAGGGRGDRVPWQAGVELTARLHRLAQGGGATFFMMLLAGFEGLLGRLAGQSDVAVGVPVAGRTQVETEGLIGFFVNTLVLRLDLGGAPDFHALMARTRDATLGAFAHQEIPFERLVTELRPERVASRNPLFQVSFAMQSGPDEPLRLPGLTLSAWPALPGAAIFDLILEAVEGGDDLSGFLEYSRDLFDTTTAARLARGFTTLLAAVADAPAQRFDDLPLLAGEERHQLLHEWRGGPSPYPRAATVHGLFAEWARRTPDAVALVSADGGEEMTYGELAARAALLARRLRGWGVGPETPVAFCLARAPRMVVALLAILEAGGAYLPLDPAYPRERLALMLDDLRQEGGGGPPLLLTEERFAGLFPWFEEAGGRLVRLDDLEPALDDPEPETLPAPLPDDVHPESLAYVMYTSGSTGRPKGVAVPHRSVVRLVRDSGYARYAPGEVVLQLAPISFDASTAEIWGALLNGGRLVLMLAETPTLAALAAVIERHRVTTLFLTSALFHQMVDDCLEGLRPVRQLLAGGDVLSPPHVRRLLAALPGLRLIACYGPTENTTFTSCWPAPPGLGAAALPPGAAVPIGRPIANTDAFVVCGEDRLEPLGPLAPIGVEGELVTGGDGLARGYWRRPELTAERFRPHPFAASPGERVYHTGDRARFLADGRLDFLGRRDRQVKVRGFRIEPAEIEATLATHPEVREAVVLALPELGGGMRLVAYLVAREAAPASAELRSWLRRRLPDYMVPQHFLALAELPQTAHGKVDRAALPTPESAAAAAAAGEGAPGAARAPRSPEEELLAGIWAEVLGRERVGLDEDFFEIGGHSLLATRVASRVREVLGVELPLRRLFEAPTVAALAPELAAARRQAGGPSPAAPQPGSRDRELPLSFAQERLWFLDQLEPGSTAYNLVLPVALRGRLLPAALAAAVAELEHRHEALRTRFPVRDGRARQEIAPPAVSPHGAALPAIDLTALPPPAREAERGRLVAALSAQPFDLARGPLVRWTLLRVDPGGAREAEHVFVIAQHHIISDGWSIGVMVSELATLYTAYVTGHASALSPLPPVALQYADYAVWQRELDLAPQLAYWRERLAGELPALELPTDRPRSPLHSRSGGSAGLDLPPELSARAAAASRRAGATPFMTLLAAWKALLHRLSGQDDLLVGMPIAGRNRAETEGTLGFFVNTLVLRSRLDGNPTFGALLAQVRETALGAYANQDLPFEKLVAELQPERDLDRTPLFQVFFNHFQESRDRIALPGLTLEPVASAPAASKFDLTVYFSESSEGFHFAVLYDAGLFDRARIEEMLRQLEQLLAAALDHPELAVGIDDISLITPHAAAVLPDPAQALAGQAGAEHAGAPLHELFARQARSFPGRLAVADGEESWTYGELAAAADRLARHLAGAGLAPGDVVAIAAERRAALAWAVLGTLGAGCAFLLLDPDYPAARRAAMLRLGGTRAFVRLPGTADIEPELAAVLAGLPPHRIVDGAAVAGPAASAVSLEPLRSVGPGDPAYVAFTSGSTGEPKAILGTHGPLTHFLAWDAATFGLGEGDRFSLLSGLGHDPLLRDLLVPLALSATLCVPPPASLERPERLLAWLAAERVSVLHLTPAFGQLLAQGAAPQAASPVLPDLRFAFFGGDLLTAADVARLRRLAPAARVVSFYGATETPQAMAWYEVPGNEAAEPGPATVPLGTGIDGVQLLVRGGWGERGVWAGIGELGEVVVRTPFLARGYLGDEALTRERFLPDPAGGGARLYRTGDLGRYRPDGRVEPAGRADRQIKIRGFRVEPAEIEAALAADPAVAEAAVVFGGGRLAAFIVPRPEALLDDGANIADIADIAVLRRLAERLPSYMVPAAILRLERLPLTPNRKIDRRALLRLLAEGEADRERAAGRVAPRDPVEEVVAGIWEEVLGPGRTGGQVGVHDSFFALGGHSLLATQVLSRLRQAFAVEMPLRQLFEAPTVAGLARAVTALLAAGSAITQPPLVPVPRGEGVELPLSFAQQRLWVLDQLEPGSFAYNFATAAQLQGGLSVAALGRALAGVVRRHEALRTVFPARDGEPRQVILPAPGTRPLPLADLAALPAAQQMAEAARLAAADSLRPFDLAGGPLLRTTLLRLGEREHTLLLAMHHIVTDGWSIGVFTRELTALYHADLQGEQAAGLPELPVQYADFAVWQRRWLQGEVLAEQLRYWSGTLAGAPPVLELPTDRPRPAVQSHRGGQRWLTLPRELAAKLGAEARRLDVTPFMALLAAFAVLLRRYTGSEDLVLGTPIANRGRRELEDLIGFFANTLALRVDAGGNPAFTELARRVRQVALGAYAHQDLPFERLVDELQPERSLGHTPVFQVMFTVQNAPAPELELGQEPREAAFRPADVDEGKAQFDLTLALMQIDGELLAKLEYSSDLFDAATAERLLGHFGNLVAAAEARPEARISTLPLLSAAERRELLITWNDSRADFPAELTVHALIAASVARRPDAVAVSCGGRQLLYGELDECAGRLARRLVRLGVGPEVRVGLCLERTPEMVVAMLAVLAAGGAYLPLDPTHPAERLSWILEDAGVRVLIADPGSLAALPANGATVVDPNVEETPEVREADEAGEPLAERATPESLAYVIYTSGSTGRPKGVEVRHRGVVNYIASMARRPGLTERDAVLALTTLSFDIAVTELLLPLAVGARIELVDRETAADAERLAAVIESAGVTVMQATPATWTLLLEGGWPGRPGLTALAGGEALPLALAERLAGRVDALWNVYGPTETTVWSTLHPVVTGQRRVPIGRPLANTAVHLLEQGGEPAPLGVPGELCIGGAGVARGYLGRPDLTADRFAPDPFGGEVGGRLYRTGDLARRLPGGDIEFLGRIDHQVKVRGYRIEPGEIEAALDDLPGVVRSAVVTRPRATGESRLIAFLAAAPGEAPPAATLRAGLQERLPDYMVPSAFVTLEALPLTPSGKIDRRALARMPLEAAAGTLGAAGEERDLVAPRNPVEELLAGIWAELLGVPRVGVHDNFFELGGDSILAIRAVARAQKSGVRLSPRDLFQHQTVAELAMVVAAPAEARGDGLPVASAVPGLEVTAADREALGRDLAAETSAAGMSGIKDAYPLTPMQQGILFHSRLAATPAGAAELYVAQFNCTLHGALDPAAFRGAWQRVIDRHAVLRTSFHWAGLDRPLQAVRRHLAAPLDVLDWRHLAAGERAAALAGLLRADRRRGFDTRQAPLLRITLLRLAEAEHQMVFSFHHLLLDGWSMPLLFGELLHLYEALHAGEEPELPPARPFRDYVEWLWRADAATAEETAAFWRRELAGFTAPTPLPLEARPAGAPGLPGAAGPAYTRRFHLLTAEETGALQRLARRGHLTLGTLVQGAWALLLARHAGAGDILFGTTSSGRPAELAGAEEMVGLFIATLPVRVAVDAAAPLFPWLAELQQRLARLRELEHSPLSEIQRWSEVRGALFDSLVIFENYPADLGLGAPPEDGSPRSLQAGGLQALQNTNYPLNLVAALHGDSLFLRLAFDAARHTAPPVERALAQLAALLRAMGAVADDPGAGAGPRLGSIASLGPAELHQLLHEWSDTGRAPAVGPPLHRLFEQRAAAAPAAPALLLDGLAVSYGEIDAHATRLAAALRRLGCAGPETLVAVALRRSPWLPIAMLAVWKAGGAFLPLDPSYPRERLAFMLADSRAGLLLAEPDLCAGDALPRPPGLRAVSVEELWTDGDARPESAAPDPGALAYVIYTSGSTGTPKGVMVEHRGLANLVREQIEAFAITPASRVLQLASSSFDASVSEVWTAWVAGAALVMLPEGSLAADEGLLRRLREHEVSVATFPPSLLAALPQTELPALATLVVAGEASSEALLARWSPGRRRVLNAYGPTEFTVCATIEPYLPELGGEPLLGRPFANTRIRLLGLLDVCDQPAAVGAAGEICLAGVGLARGYLARPDLTAAAFVPDPWSETPGGRMYRTGDLARWTGDGRLAYLGRRDAQVKVRGFRIETGEIEAALARHPDVQACAVVARRDSLVAYVVALPAADPSGPITTLDERLRAFLQSILLEPLVPNRFVTLPALPRTPSGKLDRRALPDPEAVVAGRSAPPQTDLERYVAGLWSEILGVAGIGVDDDFFRLGGHSLSGATVVARLQQDLGEIVHVVVMYDAPTVGALAAYLAEQYPQAVARLLGGAPAPGSPDEPSGAVGTADLEELRDIVARGRGVRSGHAGTGPTNPPALFVLSPPRSGSTLLRVMLAGHPQLFAPPELELLSFETLADRRAAFAGRNSFWLEGAVRALMEIQGCDAEAAEALVAAMEAEGATTGELYRRMQEWIVPRLLIDKTPSYALDPEVLARAERLFGGARYIHLVRHPLAMIRSFEEARLDQVFFRFAHRFSRRQLAELIWTLSEENILAFLAGVAPERCYMLRFEELVERPEEELRRLCGWLEIDFHPAMAAPYEHPESRMTDGIHPWSRMLGDVKFHDHRAVDPAAAHRWREAMKDHVLGGPAAGLAARLGYTPPGQPLYPALVPLKRAHGQPPQPPLVCFHAAGGDAVGYRDLAQEFGGDRPVFAMQARGLVAGETPLTSMDEMAELSLAALLAAVPAGPYYLLGWSFGGLLAYEIACRLAAAGHEVALLAILDTGPHDPTVSGASADRPLYDEAHLLAGAFEAVLPITADEIRAMPEGERLPLLFARAGATGKLPPGLDQAHAQRELATFQANQLIARTYRPGPYPGRVTLIRTPEPAEPPAGRPRRDRTLGWDRLAADVEVHEVPGTHEELIDPPWVEGLADCLRRFLEP